MKLLRRSFLVSLPFTYMVLIWIQSSYFDPESLYVLSTQIGSKLLIFLGVMLELFHLVEFGILYFLIVVAFLCFGSLTYSKEIIGIFLAFSAGVFDEIHQMNVPYRSASIIDLVKNTMGIVLFWWVIHRNYFWKPTPKFSRMMKKITTEKDDMHDT